MKPETMLSRSIPDRWFPDIISFVSHPASKVIEILFGKSIFFHSK